MDCQNLQEDAQNCLICQFVHICDSLTTTMSNHLCLREISWVSGNLSGVGDVFPNTSLVLVEHEYSLELVQRRRRGKSATLNPTHALNLSHNTICAICVRAWKIHTHTPKKSTAVYVGFGAFLCPVCHRERFKVDWDDARMQAAVVRGEQIVQQQWQKAHAPAAPYTRKWKTGFLLAFETNSSMQWLSLFLRDRNAYMQVWGRK